MSTAAPEMIRIENTRPTLLHIPAAARKSKDADGHERIADAPTFPLQPGTAKRPTVTNVPFLLWESAKKRQVVRDWLDIGWIKEAGAAAPGAPEGVSAPESLMEYGDAVAVSMVETETDATTLGVWALAEKRPAVKKAIEARIATLGKR